MSFVRIKVRAIFLGRRHLRHSAFFVNLTISSSSSIMSSSSSPSSSSSSSPEGSKTFFLLTMATTTTTSTTNKKKETSPTDLADDAAKTDDATRNDNDKRSVNNHHNSTTHAAKRPKTTGVNETSKAGTIDNATVEMGATKLLPRSNYQQQQQQQQHLDTDNVVDEGPHFRGKCPNQPFVSMPFLVIGEPNQDICYIPHCRSRGAETNETTCPMCYCYVCNKPAKQCQVCYDQHHHRNTISLNVFLFHKLFSHHQNIAILAMVVNTLFYRIP